MNHAANVPSAGAVPQKPRKPRRDLRHHSNHADLMNGVYNTGYTEAERKERSMKHSPSSFLTGRFVTGALMAGALATAIAVIPLKVAAQAPAEPAPPPAETPQAPPDQAQTPASTQPQAQPQSAPPTQPDADKPPKVEIPISQKDNPDVKAGSKADVDAIGNRDVGKGVNFYSIEREIALGKGAAQEVERSAKMIDDPVITEYVNRVGQNLVRNSDAKVPFTIKVIDSDVVNAMALPGGFFYVNSGLILRAESEAEMAGVMSHEIA